MKMKSKPTSLRSRIIVIVLGIAIGYFAKAFLPGPTTTSTTPTTLESDALTLD